MAGRRPGGKLFFSFSLPVFLHLLRERRRRQRGLARRPGCDSGRAAPRPSLQEPPSGHHRKHASTVTVPSPSPFRPLPPSSRSRLRQAPSFSSPDAALSPGVVEHPLSLFLVAPHGRARPPPSSTPSELNLHFPPPCPAAPLPLLSHHARRGVRLARHASRGASPRAHGAHWAPRVKCRRQGRRRRGRGGFVARAHGFAAALSGAPGGGAALRPRSPPPLPFSGACGAFAHLPACPRACTSHGCVDACPCVRRRCAAPPRPCPSPR